MQVWSNSRKDLHLNKVFDYAAVYAGAGIANEHFNFLW